MCMINEYKGTVIHPGNQPIRVLINNVLNAFESVYPDFKTEAIKHYGNYGLSAGIPYHLDKLALDCEDPCMIPESFEENGTQYIVLSETFLSYLWCLCFSLYIPFHEFIDKRAREQIPYDELLGRIDNNLFILANNVFSFGLSLLKNYSNWDVNRLVNPEFYPECYREIIGEVNYVFTQATTYILHHELAHVKKGHNLDSCTKSSLSKEKEAEIEAFRAIISGFKDSDDKNNKSIGVIAGICAGFFLSPSIYTEDHPDSDTRIQMYFEELGDVDDSLWSIPCFAYHLWGSYYQYELQIPPDSEEPTYHDQFLSYTEQIRKILSEVSNA